MWRIGLGNRTKRPFTRVCLIVRLHGTLTAGGVASLQLDAARHVPIPAGSEFQHATRIQPWPVVRMIYRANSVGSSENH